jgi:hypothetical protein
MCAPGAHQACFQVWESIEHGKVLSGLHFCHEDDLGEFVATLKRRSRLTFAGIGQETLM